MRKSNGLSIFLILLAFSCTSPTERPGIHEPEDLNRRDRMRYRQYIVQGKQLFLTHCSNCHQPDGKGLAKLYPPLAKSDYLLENIPRAACIIKHGKEGSIVVNGVEYNMKMTAIDQLKPLEIAEILTYVSNSWGNKKGFIEVHEVDRYLLDCDH